MAKTRTRRKGASEKYFQFPIALLNMTEDARDLVQHIVAWSLVYKGLAHSDTKEGQRADRVIEPWLEEERYRGRAKDLYYGFVKSNAKHRAAIVSTMPSEFGGLEMSATVPDLLDLVRKADAAEAHVELCQRLSGAAALGTKRLETRVAADIIWTLLRPSTSKTKGRMSLREFRVLAAVIAQVGAKPCKSFTYERIAATAAGFPSVPAYEQAVKAAQVEGIGTVSIADLSHLNIPSLPSEYGRSHQNTTALGWFRYDQAASYRSHYFGYGEPRAPLVGEGGMFEPILTRGGVLFKLLDDFWPEDKSHAPTANGRTDPTELVEMDLLEDAEPVLFVVNGRLQRGEFMSMKNSSTATFLVDGFTTVNVKVHKSFIAPARVVQDQLEAALSATPEPAGATWPPPALTYYQTQGTVELLSDKRGWFVRYRPENRAFWYSHRMSMDELTNKVNAILDGRKNVQHARRITQKKAQISLMRAKNERERELEALERELQAEANAGKPERPESHPRTTCQLANDTAIEQATTNPPIIESVELEPPYVEPGQTQTHQKAAARGQAPHRASRSAPHYAAAAANLGEIDQRTIEYLKSQGVNAWRDENGKVHVRQSAPPADAARAALTIDGQGEPIAETSGDPFADRTGFMENDELDYSMKQIREQASQQAKASKPDEAEAETLRGDPPAETNGSESALSMDLFGSPALSRDAMRRRAAQSGDGASADGEGHE